MCVCLLHTLFSSMHWYLTRLRADSASLFLSAAIFCRANAFNYALHYASFLFFFFLFFFGSVIRLLNQRREFILPLSGALSGRTLISVRASSKNFFSVPAFSLLMSLPCYTAFTNSDVGSVDARRH